MTCQSIVAIFATLAAVLTAACDVEPAGLSGSTGAADGSAPAAPMVSRPAGSQLDSHGKGAPPRYDLVFPSGKVNRIDVKIAPADWDAMRADLASMLGKFGAGGIPLPQGGQPGEAKLVARQPLWAPATVTFEGRTWHHVGVRFRGNYTLAQTWKAGKGKLPLGLDFDEFEQRFPETKDQRFWGFKNLALLNNAGDDSMLRERLAGDLFAAAGVPTPRYAFYRVFADVGQGPLYLGLYTMAEVPAPAFLASAFGNPDGNLYKPDGNGARFGVFDARSFEKKTNEKSSDHADVQAVFAALHAPRTNPVAWRAALDRAWDSDGFLRWLAVNTVVQNWDTYGVIAHNYYLYGHAGDGGRLHWIPWDNNSSFSDGFLFWRTPSLGMREVAASWPLIRFLMDDPVYKAAYLRHLRGFAAGAFRADTLALRMRTLHALIAPYVTGPDGELPGQTLLPSPGAFSDGLAKLLAFVPKRTAAVEQFLKQNSM